MVKTFIYFFCRNLAAKVAHVSDFASQRHPSILADNAIAGIATALCEKFFNSRIRMEVGSIHGWKTHCAKRKDFDWIHRQYLRGEMGCADFINNAMPEHDFLYCIKNAKFMLPLKTFYCHMMNCKNLTLPHLIVHRLHAVAYAADGFY